MARLKTNAKEGPDCGNYPLEGTCVSASLMWHGGAAHDVEEARDVRCLETALGCDG
ncbi:hypothetical protein F383_37656 [Gossypium arboreum]|uniref:Uncharacterized protein n=1 Tax=Gossypium arboreum TaxID=29729 RepID=A0A0B0MHE6_GOSAR|nr:hypothetical protein F383_37656 [Gossypium arboreum]